MEGILLTIVGILAGALITNIYNRNSLKDLREVEKNLKEINISLLAEFKKLRDHIAPDEPETASRITNIIEKYDHGPDAEPGIISEKDLCPSCSKPALEFTNFGVGPLGVNNAWFSCQSCGHRFQTHESSED